jgi:hypothetical protein
MKSNLRDNLLWSYCGSVVCTGLMGAFVASNNKYAMIPAVLFYTNAYLFIQNLKKV